MSTTPDVTVTVIVYNDAERLPRAVASLRRQTHRNIEIVISDDHSTDATPDVARRLAAADDRVTYLRLPENSGGCSAPRNRALDIARAPYLMFLDSDDELPERAVELLLAAHAEADVDFTMGAVERVRVDTGRTSTWMPHLVAERRTVRGIEAEPALFFEHLSTSKMYRRDFLDRNGLRFPEGIHYEDQLFSAQAYCLARAFTVLPEPVYRWYIAPFEAAESASISNQRHKLTNVRDRVHVQRLIDAFLVSSGQTDAVREAKDHKFLKHDFRMYAGDLPFRDEEWLRGFADIVNPYLAELSPGAYARLPRAERVVTRLVRDGRLRDARLAARGLGHGVAPRETALDGDGRVYWGAEVPPAASRGDLDVTDLGLDTRPFPSAQFRHEITRVERGPGASVDLAIRTYDPGLRLPVGPQVATLLLAPGRRRMRSRFRLDPVRPGVFEGSARLDLAEAPLPLDGFEGTRHPVLLLTSGRLRNTSLLLAPLSFPPFRARIDYRRGATPHEVTVEPEGRGTGRLQLRWTPVGVTARLIRPLARRAGARVGSRVRGAARTVASAVR
ncbi:glycosyltransferase family 2 protein [Streptomyces alfalfae]|uniref:glycosyltransferase family 2 protein n=1 Tax=Streptomyces alfalfae TaxID=1642299 RepID=UPI001FD3D72E|nr:glycosyltransferase family 2 protein [Streptomyces alfalfae]